MLVTMYKLELLSGQDKYAWKKFCIFSPYRDLHGFSDNLVFTITCMKCGLQLKPKQMCYVLTASLKEECREKATGTWDATRRANRLVVTLS